MMAKREKFGISYLEYEGYNPDRLLDTVIRSLNCKNDRAMCQVVGLQPPMLSKVRNRVNPVTPLLMIKIMDATGWTVDKVRELAGMPKDIQEDDDGTDA